MFSLTAITSAHESKTQTPRGFRKEGWKGRLPWQALRLSHDQGALPTIEYMQGPVVQSPISTNPGLTLNKT